jgi:hypothetical protein
MWNRSPATLIRNFGTGLSCKLHAPAALPARYPSSSTLGVPHWRSVARAAIELRVSECPASSLVTTQNWATVHKTVYRRSVVRLTAPGAQCSEQRHCSTAQLLSALKTPNVTDGAAASQKVREAHPTPILARNCEYCGLGQHPAPTTLHSPVRVDGN